MEAQAMYEKYRKDPRDRELLLYNIKLDEKGRSPKRHKKKKDVIVLN